jgi:UDP-glucose 4-epimerase
MKVVVTGGAGFIGANLCRLLADHPSIDEVVALDDLSTGFPGNLDGLDVDLVEGSILDEGLLARVLRGAGAVVHLAARPSVPRSIADPLASHEINATGTLRVLDAARVLGDPLVIVASSSSVYGANTRLPKSEDMTAMPISPYAVSKLASEQYAVAYGPSFGLRTLVFRFFNVFGPLQLAGHDYAAVVPAFVSAALDGRPLAVYGDGTQTRDFTYVGTVCAVIAAAIDRQVCTAWPLNLAFGSRTSLLELIGLLESAIGHELEVAFREARPGDVPHSQADGSRLLAQFPEVSAVPLGVGLAATIQWMRVQVGEAGGGNTGESLLGPMPFS